MVFSLFKKKEKSDAPAKAATMKAVQIDAYGDLSEMKYRDAPKPVPEPGEVLVRVRAAGANPFDCKVRRGILKDFYRLDMPVTLGSDFAGEIEAVGDGVPGAMRPGDRVYGLSTPMDGGTYAEYLTIDHKFARPMPQVSFEDASVMPMVGQTAWYGLVNLANVSAGQKVLVHAGAGGVGAMAIQIAKHFGAHVVTTCSTRNCDLVKELGADEIVDYTQSDFRTAIKDVDIAIDPLGGDEVNLLREGANGLFATTDSFTSFRARGHPCRSG